MSTRPYIGAVLICLCSTLPPSSRAESLATAEATARKETLQRAERLAIFITTGFDKIVTMKHEILQGQFLSFSGNITRRDAPILLKTGGTVAIRLYLKPEHQTKLQSQPEGMRTAFVNGTIRQIIPKTRTIEIDVTEIDFYEPWGPFLKL